MSNYRNNGGPELYYAQSLDGTALATFTTEASLMGGFTVPLLPARFFSKLGEESSSMKVRAYGVLGSTTTGPTFTPSIRLTTSGTTFASTVGWLGKATTVAASLTNAFWQLDVDITLRSLAVQAATSVLSAAGAFQGPGGASNGFPADGASTDLLSTFDATGTTNYWLWVGAACGTSNASNTIRLKGLKIYLEN